MQINMTVLWKNNNNNKTLIINSYLQQQKYPQHMRGIQPI